MQNEDLCGCGNPIRYTVLGGLGSCNKYQRCPTYEELIEDQNKMRLYKATLEKIRDVNACDYEYRTWAINALRVKT